MFGIEWIKRLVLRKPTPVHVLGDRSKVALSHITINQDGSKEEFVFGSLKYKDGREPVGGHKAIRILGTRGVMRPSEAVQLAMEMTPDQINAHLQCFAPEGAKLLLLLDAQREEAKAKRASK